MRNIIFYTVAGSIIWAIAHALGAGFGVSLFASFLGPPLLIIAFILYKNRR
jgi:uncharacterized membrane protein